jgi:hypothetical protein
MTKILAAESRRQIARGLTRIIWQRNQKRRLYWGIRTPRSLIVEKFDLELQFAMYRSHGLSRRHTICRKLELNSGRNAAKEARNSPIKSAKI